MSPDFPARIGPCDVIGPIGSGRLGTVYRAFHEAQSRVVIIRVLSPALLTDARRLEQFHRNARALAATGHPNVARTSDAGQDGDLVYTVTEYVDGCSLHDRLESSRLTLAEAIHVVRDVASGLQAAHGAQVVHGDLTPHSVLVSRDLSVVKVADFGSGEMEIRPDNDATVALARERIGSLLYRAPELARDSGVASERSDIYSLGVIAYQTMTGRIPVGRFSLPSDANKQVPLELDPIVLKCLAADPAQRYQSAAAFVADLDKVEQLVDYQLISELKRLSGGRLFTKRDLPKTGAQTPSRTPLYGGLAAVLLIAGALTSALLLRGRGSTLAEIVPDGAQTPAAVESPVTPAPVPDAAAAAAPPAITTVPPAPVPSMPDTSTPLTPAQLTPIPVTPVPGTPVPGTPVPGTPDPGTSAPVAPVPVTPASGTPAPVAPVPVTPSPGTSAPVGPAPATPAPGAPAASAGSKPPAPAAVAPGPPKTVTPTVVPPGGRGKPTVPAAPPVARPGGNPALAKPDSERAAETLFNEAQALIKSNQEAEARVRLATIGQLHTKSSWFVTAMTVKMALEDRRQLREFDAVVGAIAPASIATRRLLAEGAPQHPSAEAALWRLGEMYEDLRQYSLAAAAYVQLGTRFPNTRYDAWFKAGEISERRLKNNEDAVRAYLRVPASSSRHLDAQNRARRLGSR